MPGDSSPGAGLAYFSTGLRIEVRSHGSRGGHTVWIAGSGAQSWTHAAPSRFRAIDEQKFDAGLRLICLSIGFGL